MTHHQDELLAAYRKIEALEAKLKIAKDALSALKAGVEMVLKEIDPSEIMLPPGTTACLKALADISEEKP